MASETGVWPRSPATTSAPSTCSGRSAPSRVPVGTRRVSPPTVHLDLPGAGQRAVVEHEPQAVGHPGEVVADVGDEPLEDA